MRVLRSSFLVVGTVGLTAGGCTFGSPDDRFPSAQMEQLRAVMVSLANDVTEAEARTEVETREAPVPGVPSEAVLQIVDVSRETIGGFDVVTLTPKSNGSDLRVLYLHGGGWINPVGAGHFDNMAEIAERTGATVTMPLYGLAPTHTVSEATPFIDAVYQGLLDDGPASTIAIGGDSAGGNIALAQVMHWREIGVDVPAKIFLFAAALDLNFDSAGIAALDGIDVLDRDAAHVWAEVWAGDVDLSDPIVSPMFGDTTDLPPIFATVGTAEMLLDDNRRFHEALGSDIVLVEGPATSSPATSEHTLYVYPGAFHVFHHLQSLPESADLMDRLIPFLEEN